MTHVCCPDCRLRFSPLAEAYLVACPGCGEPPQTLAGLQEAVGFRLFRLDDVPHPLPKAITVSISTPDPGPGRP